MRAIAQIPLIGLIGTFTIIAGIVVPPSIIKITIAKESVFTYAYEKGQHALLTLFYSSQGDKSTYAILSEKALFQSFECDPTKGVDSNPSCPNEYKCDKALKICINIAVTKPLKTRLDEVIGKDKYCITTENPKPPQIISGRKEQITSPEPSDEILRTICPISSIRFNTAIVLPYNKDSLIKIIRIGTG